ncbi:Stealth CR1 domain-containing protein [Legionella resiliens]|uniref:Stealth CR1 domain-containing protein n=1 Tax=Legionella resiliens TaxID=2905958 RepID=A0ABS8X182_9GAMM|nr:MULTISPECIES: Stealth CR1 domain-containing protein [unclassified Legionella]MCE0723342.1 Stealth CR1 domain-containing protein [Legionella sp. 9fVS26]MCE3532495.1 Stealth CR1 domain-containing protein [Legionella sp. 8cVS16]
MHQPIDAVYTWVNCNDPQWLDEFNQYKNISSNLSSSIHKARFRDYGELFYSLLSLEKFAPWIEKIFIIKKRYQFPKIDGLSQIIKKKIIWIDEIDICPPEIHIDQFSPTFNSLAIEANLHRIPALNEQFIYFNNDMFLGRLVPEQYFFDNNQARFAVSTKIIPNILPKRIISGHDRHYFNAYQIFKKKYMPPKNLGYAFFHFPIHQCTPLFKSSYQQMWANNTIKEKLLATSQSRFRTDDNIHAVFLSCFINLYFKKAYLIQEKDYFFRLDCRNLENSLNAIKKDKPTRFCINDGLVVNKENLDVFNQLMQDLYLN